VDYINNKGLRIGANYAWGYTPQAKTKNVQKHVQVAFSNPFYRIFVSAVGLQPATMAVSHSATCCRYNAALQPACPNASPKTNFTGRNKAVQFLKR
jgi:hypothetical protein